LLANGGQSKKTEAGLEEMEAKVDIFEERLDKMDKSRNFRGSSGASDSP
jgi:hypothetical protein